MTHHNGTTIRARRSTPRSTSSPTSSQPKDTNPPSAGVPSSPAGRQACGPARGRAGGRILVTVVSKSRLPVVAEMSMARWPSSPTARSCGCLHRGATRKPSAKQARRRARTCRWPAQVASRLGGRVVYGVGQARKRTARVRTHGLARMRSAACAPASRAQRQGRPKLCRLAQAARSLCL